MQVVAATEPLTEKKRLSMKRIEQWTMEDSKRELAKYCRAETEAGPSDVPESVCDPLVDMVSSQRQTFTLQFLQSLGATMERYAKWASMATEASQGFFERDDVKAMFAPRGRVIKLPVTVIPDTPEEAAAALAKAQEEEDDDDSSSSSDSSTPVEPSADAPKLPPLENTVLSQHLQSLMVEARTLDMSMIHIQEWFTLNISGYDEADEESLEMVAKLLEELAETRSVASDRYEFYSTYLSVRSELESNCFRYPDVQSYRELMVARDLAAWEEIIRSWGLLLSAVASLNVTLSLNLKYVLAEDDDEVHNAAESTLFM